MGIVIRGRLSICRGLVLGALLVVCCVRGEAQTDGFKPEAGRMLKVLQFNFQRANLYTPEGEQAGRSVDDAILVLRHFDPDLMSLNEIEEPQAQTIAETLGYHLFFARYKPSGVQYGGALFSRNPMTDQKIHRVPGEDSDSFRCAEITTEFDGQTLHFFNTHPRFNDKPVKELQMLDIMSAVSSVAGTRILLGDFNDMDSRPNWYSHRGYINLITGSQQGTYLNSIPKLYDFQRKCGVAEQTKFNPPYYSLKTDWEGADVTANSISQWKPKVRIDHIFVSPNFFLDDPRNRCETFDTLPLLQQLDPDGKPRIVGDHRVVFAQVLLPKPAAQLVAFPDARPLALAVGMKYRLRVGGLDGDGNGVSLFDTDTTQPAGDPAHTGQIRSLAEWKLEGEAIKLTPDPFPWDYDAFVKYDRPSAATATLEALQPGKATVHVQAGETSTTVEILVLPAGELYETGVDEVKKNAG